MGKCISVFVLLVSVFVGEATFAQTTMTVKTKASVQEVKKALDKEKIFSEIVKDDVVVPPTPIPTPVPLPVNPNVVPAIVPEFKIIGAEDEVPDGEFAILTLVPAVDSLPPNMNLQVLWTIWQDNVVKKRTMMNQNNQVGFGQGSKNPALVTVSGSVLYFDGDKPKHKVFNYDTVVKFQNAPKPVPVPVPDPVIPTPKPVDPVIPTPKPVDPVVPTPSPQFPATKFNAAKTLYDSLSKITVDPDKKLKMTKAMSNLFKGQAGYLSGVPQTIIGQALDVPLANNQMQIIGKLIADGTAPALGAVGSNYNELSEWYKSYQEMTAKLVVSKVLVTGDDFVQYFNEVGDSLNAFTGK